MLWLAKDLHTRHISELTHSHISTVLAGNRPQLMQMALN